MTQLVLMQLLCEAAGRLSPTAGLHHRLMQAWTFIAVDAQRGFVAALHG